MDEVKCLCGRDYPSYRANSVCIDCKQLIPEGIWNSAKESKTSKLKDELREANLVIENMDRVNRELLVRNKSLTVWASSNPQYKP